MKEFIIKDSENLSKSSNTRMWKQSLVIVQDNYLKKTKTAPDLLVMVPS